MPIAAICSVSATGVDLNHFRQFLCHGMCATETSMAPTTAVVVEFLAPPYHLTFDPSETMALVLMLPRPFMIMPPVIAIVMVICMLTKQQL